MECYGICSYIHLRNEMTHMLVNSPCMEHMCIIIFMIVIGLMLDDWLLKMFVIGRTHDHDDDHDDHDDHDDDSVYCNLGKPNTNYS